MNKLITELQRLYFLPDQQGPSQQADDGGKPAAPTAGEQTIALQLVDADSMVRTMLIHFAKPSDWERVANLYQAVQDELDLPAPAISVSGQKGYHLWFSLAEPVPVAQAGSFLDALRRNYLADIPAAHLELRPAAGQAVTERVPALHPATGKWSAFIDPSLGAMFVDEPGLEMAPNMGRQADLLAGLKSIKTVDFQKASSVLQTQPESATNPGLDSHRTRSRLNVGNHYSSPKSFLLAVMNDPSASARQRIRAAKALLPYFAKDA